MKPESIIEELKQHGELRQSTMKEVEENRELRLALVHYFEENKNREFAIEFLKVLTELRRSSANSISGDSLMLACYILGKHRHVEDCIKIWEAKKIDFDTYCYIDVQLIVFAGVQATIEYLQKEKSNENSMQILEHILACSKAGDFDNLNKYFTETPWYV